MTGQPLFRPCTPYGVMKMLESEGVALRGAEAVIVGASNIVGKPMAMLLLQAGATITICNSKTRDLAAQTRRADVLVVATGKPGMIDGSMIAGRRRHRRGHQSRRRRQAVRRRGLRLRQPGGRRHHARAGRRGPMTIAMLLVNTVEAAERAAGLTA